VLVKANNPDNKDSGILTGMPTMASATFESSEKHRHRWFAALCAPPRAIEHRVQQWDHTDV
jgi:hypothetical protein